MFDHRGAGGAARQTAKSLLFNKFSLRVGVKKKHSLRVSTVRILAHWHTVFCVFRAVHHVQPKIKIQINYMSLQSSLSSEIDLIDDSDEEQEVF